MTRLVARLGLVLALLCGAGPVLAQEKVWRHGVVEAKADSGIAFMPAQHDFAAKQGLKIEYIQFKGDALAIKAFLAGELDSYESSPGGAIIAASHGADVKLTGCYWTGLTYGIFSKGAAASVKDLAGKTFAISGPGSLPDLVGRAALTQAAVPARDVRFAVLGSDADRFRALSQSVVDAAAFSTEFLPMAQDQGMTMIFNAAEQLPNYVRFCVYVNSATLRDRFDEASGFLAAGMQGWRYALGHKDEAVALARKLSGAKPEDPRPDEVFTQVTKYHAVDPSAPVPMDKLNWIQNLLVETGNLKAPYDLSKLVDTRLREAALAKAGG